MKNALITGATAGIGSEFAELMASKGYALALVARDKARLAERSQDLQTRYKIRVLTLAKDLANPASAPEISRELQEQDFPVSVLVNNAGSGVYGPFAKVEQASGLSQPASGRVASAGTPDATGGTPVPPNLERELQMLQVNMISLVQLTKLFLQPMISRREGRILNVASTTSFQPGPYLSLYSASKAFVLSFSCALAVELEGSGVTVTALCPGGTATEFQQRAGMKQSAFSRPMTARSVAEIGYDAMIKGKPVVVAGLKNKLMVAASRRAPVMLSARMAAKINKAR